VSTVVRLEDMPADERMDFLHEVSATLWVPMGFAGDGIRRAEFRVSGPGPMQVVVIDGMPVTVSRTPRHIEQADPDLLKAFVACGGGTSVIAQDGRQRRSCDRASSPSTTSGGPRRAPWGRSRAGLSS